MVNSATIIFQRILKDVLLAKDSDVIKLIGEIGSYDVFKAISYRDLQMLLTYNIITYCTFIKVRLFYRYV